MLYVGLVPIASMLLLGCESIKAFPEIKHYPEQIEVFVRGKIVCDGDKKYIPRTISDSEGFNENIVLSYQYDDAQGYYYKIKVAKIVGKLEI
jgi:hypothetical protein